MVINKIKGININTDNNFWYLHVSSGEKWRDLVSTSLKNNIFGIENLALIPGTVGAAPIQNIGAYGMEFKQVCQYIDLLDCNNKKIIRLNKNQCLFEYRNSIFKHCYKKGFIIIAVGIYIKKKWIPNIHYFKNTKIDKNPFMIYKYICNIRKKKLPDPKIIGNAGSIFKNPTLDINQINFIKKKFTDIIVYKVYENNLFRISAGWMIEKCNLKGYSIGNAAVYNKNALLIINKNNNATSKDVISLCKYVYNVVYTKFNILLELEVNII